jgi:hypothetical protein
MESRRTALKMALAGAASGCAIGTTTASQAAPSAGGPRPAPQAIWPRGVEGQRKADCGDGRYLNPILPGDFPDPSVLKDGDDYYMTHSSFDAAPGLLIWHSRDLVNWRPLGPALAKPLGTVFAVDIAKHDGRYFIYIPFMKAPWSPPLASFANIYVIHAPSMEGPWSEPIDLGVGGLIDPGHVVGEDGRRYLFFNEGKRVPLTPDGLATAGPVETAYQAWHYPDDWITEAWSPEGPKLFRRGEWFYLVNAVGGTSGPATGHMVAVARAHSINGPWENCPHNPIVRAVRRRSLVVARPCDLRRRAGRCVVHGLSCLRKRVPHAGPANRAGADGLDRRWLVSRHRRRFGPAAAQTGRRGRAARHGAVRRFRARGAGPALDALCQRARRCRAGARGRQCADPAGQAAGRRMAPC